MKLPQNWKVRKPHLLLVTALIASVFCLRSLVSWRPQTIFEGVEQVSELVFSDDSKTLLVAVYAPVGVPPKQWPATTLNALDAQSGFKLLWQYQSLFGAGRNMQFFARDSQLLVSGLYVQTIDAHTGELRKDYGLSGYAAMSPNGRWLAYKGEDDRRILLNPATRKNQSINGDSAEKSLGKWNENAFAHAFSPDGKILAVGVGDSSGAHLDFYDVKNWHLLRRWDDLKESDDGNPTYQGLQWSHNGKFLLSVCNSNNQQTTCLWRASDGRKLDSFTFDPSPTSKTQPYRLQDDGRLLSWNTSGHISLQTSLSADARPEFLLYLPGETIIDATISPDGTCLVAGTKRGRVYKQRLK